MRIVSREEEIIMDHEFHIARISVLIISVWIVDKKLQSCWVKLFRIKISIPYVTHDGDGYRISL